MQDAEPRDPIVEFLDTQRAAALDDAGVLRQLAVQLHFATMNADVRAVTLARSVAAYALNLAARLDATAAFEAGADAGRRPAPRPPGDLQRRRRAKSTRGGMRPLEYHVGGGEWLTVAELAERVGISYQAMLGRLHRKPVLAAVLKKPRRPGGTQGSEFFPLPTSNG